MQHVDIRDEHGFVVDRRPPPRKFKLSYMVTAWTQRPEDEHRLLAALLACFVRYEVFPARVLSTTLVDQGYPVALSIAQPPPDNRKVPDIWSSLGGDLKPSLDLVVTLTVDMGLFKEAADEVVAPLRVRSVGTTTFPDLVDDDKVGRLPDGFEPAAAGEGR